MNEITRLGDSQLLGTLCATSRTHIFGGTGGSERGLDSLNLGSRWVGSSDSSTVVTTISEDGRSGPLWIHEGFTSRGFFF